MSLQLDITADQLQRFDEASNHPYECRCDLCKEFWAQMPPEEAECTARLATPICKLPPTPKMVAAGFNKFKTASLGEAYMHFTGKELEGAHSARADVHGCMEVYFAIKGAK